MKIIFLERKYFTISTHFYSKNKKLPLKTYRKLAHSYFFFVEKAFFIYNSL